MKTASKRPIALVIIDGLGIPDRNERNIYFHASTPYLDAIRDNYPSTELLISDDAGPEIGHMTIGAGRIVKSDAGRVLEAIENESFFENPTLVEAMQKAKGSALHLIGLLSDANIHSCPDTLYALLRMAKRAGVTSVFVHAILDGRDVPPRSADVYVEALEIKMADIGVGRVASVVGRFFAMDNSQNWERTARAFTMLAHGEGERFADARTAIQSSFLRGISDEFIAPMIIDDGPHAARSTIKSGDVVIFFNHRGDSTKQLVRSLAVPDFGNTSSKPSIHAVCLTEYDKSYGLSVAFQSEPLSLSVASLLEEHAFVNYRISDDDRFPHITEFFNCSPAAPPSCERRINVPAAPPSTRETEPEQMSFKTTDKLISAIDSDPSGVFVVNLPGADLVTETGNFERAVEAVEYIDTCIGGIVEKLREHDGVALVTSSHSNCTVALGEGRRPGASSASPSVVPFYLVDESSRFLQMRGNGSLYDVGATLLAVAGIDIPSEMTGRDLRLM